MSNQELKFRRAKVKDLEEIFNIFELAIENMNRNNINQWDEAYPNKEILLEDIKAQELYVGYIRNEIVSIYVINEKCDKEYQTGEWRGVRLTYRIIHRLCVNPNFQNQGIGTLTMMHIEESLKKEGIQSVRLDVFSKNPFAIRLYQNFNYKRVGYADWRKGRFYLMEKIL